MTNPTEPGWGTPVAGLQSWGQMVVNAVETYERTVNLAQSWFEGILATHKEQAETYRSLLRSIDTSLRALEQVVEAQSQITEALGESLRASRETVTVATSSNQHSIERIESFVKDVQEMLTGQLKALKSQVDIGQTMLADPLSTQSAAFLKMTEDWRDAYGRMLSENQPFKTSARDE